MWSRSCSLIGIGGARRNGARRGGGPFCRVLLLTWNRAFYRYGPFDFGKLEACIAENMAALKAYRARSILDYAATDEAQIKYNYAKYTKRWI